VSRLPRHVVVRGRATVMFDRNREGAEDGSAIRLVGPLFPTGGGAEERRIWPIGLIVHIQGEVGHGDRAVALCDQSVTILWSPDMWVFIRIGVQRASHCRFGWSWAA
jgi:hypothetical protein